MHFGNIEAESNEETEEKKVILMMFLSVLMKIMKDLVTCSLMWYILSRQGSFAKMVDTIEQPIHRGGFLQ